MYKSKIVQDISTLIADAGLDSIDFFGCRNHPTIERDYTTYEIWSIIPEEDGTITLSTIPVDPWTGKVEDLTLDSSWRMPTIEKVKRIVEKRLNIMGVQF